MCATDTVLQTRSCSGTSIASGCDDVASRSRLVGKVQPPSATWLMLKTPNAAEQVDCLKSKCNMQYMRLVANPNHNMAHVRKPEPQLNGPRSVWKARAKWAMLQTPGCNMTHVTNPKPKLNDWRIPHERFSHTRSNSSRGRRSDLRLFGRHVARATG